MPFPYITIIALAVIIFVFYFFAVRPAKRSEAALRKGFESMDTPVGKSFKEIKALFGTPRGMTVLDKTWALCEWRAGSFYIALLFDRDDICVDIYNISTT